MTRNSLSNRLALEVSIHTPIQGVTNSAVNQRKRWEVSIHTPIQGVTSIGISSIFDFASFNPHTHTGCDEASTCPEEVSTVSIHTPIQGVTIPEMDSIGMQQFQSTHPYRV